MRVLIYGGREFSAVREANDFLDYHFNRPIHTDITVISGGARGADGIGEQWAEDWGLRLEVFPADWKAHGKAAGHIRNQQMLDSGVDIAVQFPGGKGTADMRRRLDKAGVRVYEFRE